MYVLIHVQYNNYNIRNLVWHSYLKGLFMIRADPGISEGRHLNYFWKGGAQLSCLHNIQECAKVFHSVVLFTIKEGDPLSPGTSLKCSFIF